MEYVNLGTAGVKVSRLCLGCAYFGALLDADEAQRLVRTALDVGINFFDAANAYSLGRCEELLGRAVAGHRDQVVLATKVGRQMDYGPNDWGHSRYHIMSQVEASLRRLGTDYIDLYQLHLHDPTTPQEETLRALDDLRRQGKVRYFGTSNFPAWRLCQGLWTSDRLGFASFVTEAPAYSLFNREVESDVLPFCRAYGLGLVCYSPLGGGWLSGKYRRGLPMPADSRFARRGTLVDPAEHERAYDVLEGLEAIAQAKQLSLSQLALAWLLAQPGVTAANFGPRTPDQLREDIGALEVELTDADLAAIDEIVPPGSQVLSRVPAPGGIVIADPIPPSGMTSSPR